MQLAGNNYVEISQHMGARPLCAEDQGKIFSLNDDTTPIEDGLGNKIKVYAWSQSSYGEPAGILGINCGHSRYAFIPGMSIHRERKINKAENDEAYQERQTQRYYERQIRNKKREIEMLKETGAEPDYIKSKQKQLSSFNSQYNSWLKETDRYRDYGNEWIGTKIPTNKQQQKITKSLESWNNKVESKRKIQQNFIIKEQKKYKILSNQEYIEMSKKQIITTKEKQIIINGSEGYVGTNNSFYINNSLRELKKRKEYYKNSNFLSNKQKKVVETLTKVINKNKTTVNLFATRELDRNYLHNVFGEELKNYSDYDIINKINNEWIGKTIPSDGGFFSCALNNNKILRRKVKLNVYIPEKTKGYIADNLSESEIILGRTIKYDIMGSSIENSKGMNKIVIDIVIR